MMKFFRYILRIVFCSLFTLNCVAQTGTAHIYVGLYDNLDKENLQVTLLDICSRYEDFRIFISNDQFPVIISNQYDLNYFFRNQILLLNPTYPDIYFELDTLLKLDAKKEFLSFNANNQPKVISRLDYHFFLPTESAIRITKELVLKYYQIMGFGDIEYLEKNIPVTIYSKEMPLDFNASIDSSGFKFAFKTY